MKNKQLVLILHNIRSTHNVGSIFRTADAVGVSKIFLSGYTPTPVDRFSRKRKDFTKVSLGAEKSVSWEHKEDVFELIKNFKKEGFKIIALEQDKKSVDYRKVKLEKKMAIVLGTEVGGIDKKILRLCDEIAEIPMLGEKDSLNVSVATGVFLYQLLD